LLVYERDNKYRKYETDVQPNVSGTKKNVTPFKPRDKPISNGEDCVLKIMSKYHNHDLSTSKNVLKRKLTSRNTCNSSFTGI